MVRRRPHHQETADLVFHDPAQADGMLVNLATDHWANDIPGYSFDAVAMLPANSFSPMAPITPP